MQIAPSGLACLLTQRAPVVGAPDIRLPATHILCFEGILSVATVFKTNVLDNLNEYSSRSSEVGMPTGIYDARVKISRTFAELVQVVCIYLL